MVEYEKLLSRELPTTGMHQLHGLVSMTDPGLALDSKTAEGVLADNGERSLDETDNRIEMNSQKRRAQLDRIIKTGLDRMEEKKIKYTIAGHEFVLQDQIAQAAGAVENIKDFVGAAVEASPPPPPPAAAAWAGVCLILPILTNPIAAEQANKDGFTYVTSRIRFYVALEHMLLPKNAAIGKDMKDAFERDIINLYRHILEFSSRASCDL